MKGGGGWLHNDLRGYKSSFTPKKRGWGDFVKIFALNFQPFSKTSPPE